MCGIKSTTKLSLADHINCLPMFTYNRIGGAPDVCVDALLEASVKHSPHFDWVVAHIGFVFLLLFPHILCHYSCRYI